MLYYTTDKYGISAKYLSSFNFFQFIISCNCIKVKGVADDRLWSDICWAVERRCVDRLSSRPVSDDALHGGAGWKPTQSPVTGLQYKDSFEHINRLIHGGSRDAPFLGPNFSFIFMQFSAKILSINKFSAHTQGLAPPLHLWLILDSPLLINRY